VLLLSGSPAVPSRSTALLDAVGAWLCAAGQATETTGVRDLPALDLLYGETRSEAVRHFATRVARARALVIATPVYKASLSGALKVMLDVLPEQALVGKPVLTLATAGSAAHLLAVDYALKPVLSALGARHVLGPVFGTDAELLPHRDGYAIAPALRQRLQAAATHLAALLEGGPAFDDSDAPTAAAGALVRCVARPALRDASPLPVQELST
jgi:FMN reductase